ncbi:MAG: YlxR family protein [Lachnospiraceae bacterium]|nr:YlxR family protein [Lachnospiraceae bacterium]
MAQSDHKDKRVPVRTCVGCARSGPKDSFLRIVLENDPFLNGPMMLKPDEEGRLPGRGAYICRCPECLDLAFKKKGFNRAFRRPVDGDLVIDLKKRLFG